MVVAYVRVRAGKKDQRQFAAGAGVTGDDWQDGKQWTSPTPLPRPLNGKLVLLSRRNAQTKTSTDLAPQTADPRREARTMPILRNAHPLRHVGGKTPSTLSQHGVRQLVRVILPSWNGRDGPDGGHTLNTLIRSCAVERCGRPPREHRHWNV
jgi:hypothetical protein